MKRYAKKFSALMILAILFFGVYAEKIEAAEFQELKKKIVMPVLPDRLRKERPSDSMIRRKFPMPVINFPRHKDEITDINYVQKHPKTPPPIHSPKTPQRTIDKRGAAIAKNFGPPRSKFRR